MAGLLRLAVLIQENSIATAAGRVAAVRKARCARRLPTGAFGNMKRHVQRRAALCGAPAARGDCASTGQICCLKFQRDACERNDTK
jgi:hypothetical protein